MVTATSAAPGEAPALVAIPPDDAHVRHVRETVAKKLIKISREDAAVRERNPDLFGIGFGLLSGSSSSPRGLTFVSRLVRADDWAGAGYLVSRGTRKPGGVLGYMRAELTGGDLFEAYAADVGVTTLYHDGQAVGAWRSVEYTYEGRFREPLARELWAGDHRLGVVDTSLMSSGAAVLELDPEPGPEDEEGGHAGPNAVLPLRVRRSRVIQGNPFAELFKATPFGKRLGPRRPNLDLVLAPHAAWLSDTDRLLLFVASLALRTLICGKPETSGD